MNEVLEQMQANVTNGEEYFCDISEKKLEAMKVLARKEKEELERLQQENKKLRETIKADEKANLILANDNRELRERIDKTFAKINYYTNCEISNSVKYSIKQYEELKSILKGDK